MTRRDRIHYTESDKALMWERWKSGDTLLQIAHLFDRHHPSIIGFLQRQVGSVRPHDAAPDWR